MFYYLLFIVSLFLIVQTFLKFLAWYAYSHTFKRLNKVYTKPLYLKIGLLYLGLFIATVVCAYLLALPILNIFSLVFVIIMKLFFDRYFTNLIYENEQYLYNGAYIFRKSAINKVYLEYGVNLEKQLAKQKHFSVLKRKYLVFKLKNKYIVVKGFDSSYLNYFYKHYL